MGRLVELQHMVDHYSMDWLMAHYHLLHKNLDNKNSVVQSKQVDMYLDKSLDLVCNCMLRLVSNRLQYTHTEPNQARIPACQQYHSRAHFHMRYHYML